MIGMQNQDNRIMVSVWCRTYNHVNYIRDALEGFVSQQTNFTYKVIVFDDASTDGTSDIVREYEAKYPDIIHAIISEENLHHHSDGRKITLDIWNKFLTGKYMAFCEGDDFWIDNNKLQIQVDYMEAHQECSMYIHNALWLNCQNGTMKAGDPFQGSNERNITAEELIMQYNSYPATASFLCKSEQIRRPQFFSISPAGDYAAVLYSLATGNVHYSNRIMSVYRVFANGSHGVRMQKNDGIRACFYLRMSIFLTKYDEYTDYKYHAWCAKRKVLCEYALMYGSDLNTLIAENVRSGEEPMFAFSAENFEYVNELEKRRKRGLSTELETFTSKYEHIIIMGTGEFGIYAARQLMNNNIEFGGFAVTARKDGETSFMGKPVWNLSDLPYDRSNTGVVIGICPFSGKWPWRSILNSLESAGIVNYYCPF